MEKETERRRRRRRRGKGKYGGVRDGEAHRDINVEGKRAESIMHGWVFNLLQLAGLLISENQKN